MRDANFAGAFLESRIIADSLIGLFRTVTAYPEVIPKKCGSVRVGDKNEAAGAAIAAAVAGE